MFRQMFYYSNASCLYEKRDNDKTVEPSFTPIDNFNYANQLRVLTISNENFEVDLVLLYDEFMLSKNQIKEWYQSHSFLAGDSVVVFSVSPSVSTRNFGAQLLCPLLTVVGATLVVK